MSEQQGVEHHGFEASNLTELAATTVRSQLAVEGTPSDFSITSASVKTPSHLLHSPLAANGAEVETHHIAFPVLPLNSASNDHTYSSAMAAGGKRLEGSFPHPPPQSTTEDEHHQHTSMDEGAAHALAIMLPHLTSPAPHAPHPYADTKPLPRLHLSSSSPSPPLSYADAKPLPRLLVSSPSPPSAAPAGGRHDAISDDVHTNTPTTPITYAAGVADGGVLPDFVIASPGPTRSFRDHRYRSSPRQTADCGSPTPAASNLPILTLNPQGRSIWVRFRNARATQVEIEPGDVNIDHLKKRLKNLFPRHLGHLEAFEFTLKHHHCDPTSIEEDTLLDDLKPRNSALSPLYIDAAEAPSPQGVPLLATRPGALCTPPPMAQMYSPRPLSVGSKRAYSETGARSPVAMNYTAESNAITLFGESELALALRNKAGKKAADGLCKGHAVILLYQGEDVGKGKILSCERNGQCRIRLKSYSDGAALTTDGKALRDVGDDSEILWPRFHIRRDHRAGDSCGTSNS